MTNSWRSSTESTNLDMGLKRNVRPDEILYIGPNIAIKMNKKDGSIWVEAPKEYRILMDRHLEEEPEFLAEVPERLRPTRLRQIT